MYTLKIRIRSFKFSLSIANSHYITYIVTHTLIIRNEQICIGDYTPTVDS